RRLTSGNVAEQLVESAVEGIEDQLAVRVDVLDVETVAGNHDAGDPLESRSRRIDAPLLARTTVTGGQLDRGQGRDGVEAGVRGLVPDGPVAGHVPAASSGRRAVTSAQLTANGPDAPDTALGLAAVEVDLELAIEHDAQLGRITGDGAEFVGEHRSIKRAAVVDAHAGDGERRLGAGSALATGHGGPRSVERRGALPMPGDLGIGRGDGGEGGVVAVGDLGV